MIEKEKGIMAVTVNYKYIEGKPNYKNFVLVGKKTNKCYKNGAPKAEGLEEIYDFSDGVADVITQSTKKSRLVGILTYQCTGFDVYYVKDTLNLRNKIDSLYQKDFPNAKTYLVINKDKRWNYYKEVLYPKNESEDFFMSQDLLSQLFFEGVDLTTKRSVNHYLYFKKAKNRDNFLEAVKTLDFSIDSLNFEKNKDYPFEIKMYRGDELLPMFVAEMTKVLRVFSTANNGYYDGWGID